MKALGASTETIRNIFVVESSIVGLVGGVIGLITAVVLGYVIMAFNVAFVFDTLVIVGSIIFSMALGLISGTFPALDAAKVDPIEALRYE